MCSPFVYGVRKGRKRNTERAHEVVGQIWREAGFGLLWEIVKLGLNLWLLVSALACYPDGTQEPRSFLQCPPMQSL